MGWDWTGEVREDGGLLVDFGRLSWWVEVDEETLWTI